MQRGQRPSALLLSEGVATRLARSGRTIDRGIECRGVRRLLMEATWKRQNAVSRNTSGADVAREPARTAGRSRLQGLLAPYKQEVTGSIPVPPIVQRPLPKRHSCCWWPSRRAFKMDCGSVVEALAVRGSLADGLRRGVRRRLGPQPTPLLEHERADPGARDPRLPPVRSTPVWSISAAAPRRPR